MDNVMNRPLFRRREARDRLNEMAGVQGYQVGGPILSGMEMEARRVIPSPVTAGIATMTPQVIETENYGSFLFNPRTNQLTDRQGNRVPPDAAQAILQDAASLASRLGISSSGAGATAEQDVMSGFEALSTARPSLAAGITKDLGRDLEQARSSLRAGEEQLNIFEELSRAADKPVPEGVPRGPSGARPSPVAPTGLPASDLGPQGRTSFVRPTPGPAAGMPAAATTEAAPTTPAVSPTGPSGMEMEARGRGPAASNPAATISGMNDADPAVRERTVQDFMREYAEMAPKYDGADRNLMHAMIGFAIAAGDSPNAMSNIANGLLAGTEMMAKDKASKAEFDRQIQLNAMQYGVERVNQERERGRPALQFTASKDMTFNGREVKAGDPVYLSYADIEKNGGVVPSGLVDAAMYKGLAEKESALHALRQEQYDRGVIDDDTLRTESNDYSRLVGEVTKNQRALDYFERALFVIGKDGNLTGAPGAFKKWASKVAGFAGVSIDELDSLAAAGDVKKLEELLTRGTLDSVPSVMEGQSANSISNMDVELAIKRLVEESVNGGSFSRLFTTEDTVIRQIQDTMAINASNRQRAFAEMSAIENRLANRYTKAGDYFAPVYASDTLQPLREVAGIGTQAGNISSFGDIIVGENGRWRLVLPGS